MARCPTFPTLYDDLKRINISDLKRWKYLETGKSRRGVVTWSNNDEVTGSVSIFVNLRAGAPYLELDYSADGKPVRYRVSLVSLPSNLGNGVVWYFLCPETGKLCRKLYLHGTRFLHRDAVTGALYSAQAKSKRWRDFGALLQILKRDEPFNKKYAKKHYRGQPTKRFLRFLRRAQRSLEKAEGNPLFK